MGRHSDTLNELATAIAKAQSEIKGAAKDSANPFFKSKYADLSSVWDACRAPLTKNGLSVIQLASAEGNKVTVETVLLHTSGQLISEALSVTAKEDSPQAVGSAITYARRYGLAAIVGVAPEDDDGEAAEARPGSGKPVHRPPPNLAGPVPMESPGGGGGEAIVQQIEAVTAQTVPEHVKPLFDLLLRQADPRGPNGTHTAEQVAYSMKLLSDAAGAILPPGLPMDKWTPGMVKTLTRHFGIK